MQDCEKRSKDYYLTCLDRRQFLKGVGLIGLSIFLGPSLAACGSKQSSTSASPSGEAGGQASKKILRIRHAVSFSKEQEETLQNLGTWKFKELVEKYSNGEIIVDIYPSEQLGSQREVAEKVQAGALEIAHLSTQNLCQLVPVYNLLDFPFMFPTREKFAEVMQSDFVKKVLHKEVEKKGVKVLWYCPTAFRSLGHNLDKPVKLPEDIKGVKVRVTGSAVEQEAFRLAGAKPTPVNWSETYTAMQQRIVDAVHVGLAPLYNYKIHETFKRVTNLNMMLNSELHICNKKWFDSLSADQKSVLEKAAAEVGKWIVADQEEKNKKVEEIYKKLGIEIYNLTAEERKVWIDTVGHQLPAWDKMKEQWGKDIYLKLVELASK